MSEHVKQITTLEQQMKNTNEKLDKLALDNNRQFDNLGKKIDKMCEQYTTKEEFEPVKLIAYGLIGTVMLGFIGSVLTLIFI